jgi:MerR family transcriptional regulator, light-induced transcriptional regulator
MDTPDGRPVLRIGELSRRAGVSDHLLRAWESRYGLLQPVRSAGGYRLYSETDALRVRRMQDYLAQGLSAAEAARAVLREDGRAGAGPGPAGAGPAGPDRVPADGELPGMLQRALDAFDEPAAQAVLDRLFSDLSLAAALRDVVMPYLARLGERWEQGAVSIAQEHFATNVIRGRLAGLARGWGNGHGPRALLACPSGDFHDLALMVFGIVLNRSGWRIGYLGANTPLGEVTRSADAQAPDLVVVAATLPGSLAPLTEQLTALAQRAPLLLAGPGATPGIAATVGARLVTGDPVTAAESVGWPR